MRILYIWDSEYPWDVRAEKFCLALTRAGHSVQLVARNRGWQPIRQSLPEATVVRMRPWQALGRRVDSITSFPAFFNPRWIRLIKRAVETSRPDIILVRDLPLCPTALGVARVTGTPVVLDMAEHYPEMVRLIWRSKQARPWDILVRNPLFATAVEHWCIRRCAHILVDTEEHAHRLQALGIPTGRLTVIRNTPPLRPLPEHRSSTSSDPLELVYVGLLEIPRGLDDVLQAVAALHRHEVRLHLTIIGTGRDEDHFRRTARVAGLSENLVTFTGFLDNSTAMDQVGRADIGLSPIWRTPKHDVTVPNKIFDYMMSGIAVVTSDSLASARVVRETGCGVIFRSGDVDDLVRAILTLTERECRQTCAHAGRRAAQATYHWERDAEALCTCLDTVFAERRKLATPSIVAH